MAAPPPPPPPVRGAWASRQRALSGPDLNVSDVPEMMPGAGSRANPTEREHFESQCKKLWKEESKERSEAQAVKAEVKAVSQQVDAQEQLTQMQNMFPMLDPDLVRTLVNEAPRPEMAMETLLALSMEAADPESENANISTSNAPPPPPKDVGLEDESKFPSLVDKDGWQVMNKNSFVHKDEEEEKGSAWRDTAKEAAPLPAPKKAWKTVDPKRSKKPTPKDEDDDEEDIDPYTDYDARQKCGERRANRIARKAAERRSKVGSAGYAQPGGRIPSVHEQQEGDEASTIPSEDEI